MDNKLHRYANPISGLKKINLRRYYVNRCATSQTNQASSRYPNGYDIEPKQTKSNIKTTKADNG